MKHLSESDTSDHDLVAECLKGHSFAWEALLGRYKRLIYSVPVRYGFDIEDRHEIFQTVCLEILRNLPALRDASKIRQWVLTISIRECKNLIDRNRRDRRFYAQDTVTESQKDPIDAMAVYLWAERLQILREALEELPERCRMLIHSIFLSDEKLSYAEVAESLDLSKDTIGSMRQRCLERLRTLLESRDL